MAVSTNNYVLPEYASKPVMYFNDADLVHAAKASDSTLLFDLEVFPNFFYAAFKCFNTGKVVAFEKSFDHPLNVSKLRWVVGNFRLVGFNSYGFDLPVLWAAIYGFHTEQLQSMATAIIEGGLRPYEIESHYAFKMGFCNHIDLQQVAPGAPSFTNLKQYGARLHCPTVRDLPFPPAKPLSQQQAEIVKAYCINDLDETGYLFHELQQAITLRENLGLTYELDLRSKSDAQVAEAIIRSEIEIRQGSRPYPPKGLIGKSFKYKPPQWVAFQTQQLQEVFDYVCNMDLYVNGTGHVDYEEGFSKMQIRFGKQTYTLGKGGLHSTESRVHHRSDNEWMIVDRDVASYYPSIILNEGWFPEHIGEDFLDVYRELYDQRLAAKKAKDKVTADSLKIVINGTFGKTSNRFSCIYAPWLMIYITLTGQLALLMLIEQLEAAGIEVISANTDGVVSRVHKDQYGIMLWVIQAWEAQTGFVTEETLYKGLYSRDVNTYFAIKHENDSEIQAILAKGETPKPTDWVKAKGDYVCPYVLKPGARERMTSNPARSISIEAAMRYCQTYDDAKPQKIADTIKKCDDFRKFLFVRKCKGGAVKDGVFLGRVVRWYQSVREFGSINYKTSGNQIAGSKGGTPCMELPTTIPDDLDYQWYIREAEDILSQVGLIEHLPLFNQ